MAWHKKMHKFRDTICKKTCSQIESGGRQSYKHDANLKLAHQKTRMKIQNILKEWWLETQAQKKTYDSCKGQTLNKMMRDAS